MRRFLALFGREWRDARWNLAASFAVAAAAPWVVHGLVMDGAPEGMMALFGGRVIVPILFALFAAATASDLVSRDVATRRIDALASLPVPGARVWTAKAAFLGVACALFLTWTVAVEVLAVNVLAAAEHASLIRNLGDGVPSILGGVAIGAAALFFSTLMERGMTAAIAALVALTAIAWWIQIAEIPVQGGETSGVVAGAVPLAIAAAFTVASRMAYVRGPIHGPSRLRVAMTGVVALAALLAPAGTCLAVGLESSSELPAGAGDANLRAAYVSPDEKWVAIEDRTADGASRTWIAGLADVSFRSVAEGPTWFADGVAWLPGSMLSVRTSTFSVLDGPRHVRRLEIEPSRLGVADERRVRRDEVPETPWSARWAWVSDRRTRADGSHMVQVNWHGGSRRFVCRDVVPGLHSNALFVISDAGGLTLVNVNDDTTVELVHEGVIGARIGAWDGAMLFVETTSGMRIHDAFTGATLLDSLGRLDRFPNEIGAGRRVLLSKSDASGRITNCTARDLTTGAVVDLGAPRMNDRAPRVTWMKDGRFVVCDGDVTLRDAQGRTIRRLFPPDSKEN